MQTSIQLNNNIFLDELQRKGDIECFDKIMDSHMHYPSIVYSYIRKFRESPRFLLELYSEYFSKKSIITIFSRNYNYEFKPIE
jgi:hypothetical protein